MGWPTSDATWQGKTYCFLIKNCFLLREAAFASHMKAGGPVESGLQACHNKCLNVDVPNNRGFLAVFGQLFGVSRGVPGRYFSQFYDTC